MRGPFLLALFATVVAAQPRLAFEVVSIKTVPRPTPGSTARFGYFVNGPRVEIIGYELQPLIARAFHVENPQVDMHGFGGFESFEVQAKLPEGATPDEIPAMIQTMLADRFKLAFHRETRDYTSTVVTIGRNGMKLVRLPDSTPRSSNSTRLADGGYRRTDVGTITELFPVMNSFGGFAQMVDQTGLEGIYTWVQEQQPATPSVTYQQREHESFEAMFDAAGLKLEVRKIPRETIVVDSVEKLPSEN
jgi:uncharacterized protein (TIGR03435 family)